MKESRHMSEAQIQISKINTETIRVPIRGTSPLIVNKFSAKAKQQMLDTMQGRKVPKQPKDPDTDYLATLYRHDDGGYGFPVIGLKAATVGAARFFDKSVTMTGLRQYMFFDAEFSKVESIKLLRIEGEPVMREDVVRVGQGGTDLRYRAEFTEWSTAVNVVYVVSALTRDSIVSLIEAGGMGVGIGEWRPERKGDFGTYQIDESREVQVLS
jgi:hypothetical protein